MLNAKHLCGKKRRYDTPADADAAKASQIKSDLSKGFPRPKLRYYLCPLCRCWHVGHNSRGGRSRKGKS